MIHCTKISVLALTLVISACGSPLQKAKDEAVKKLSENTPLLLKEAPLDHMDLELEKPGKEAVDIEGGIIFVPSPTNRHQNDRGITLEYPEFSAIIMTSAGGGDFSALPQTWGDDDLDKLRLICSASERNIDVASNLEELEEAVALLTARGTVAPAGLFNRLIWLESDRFVGMLSGDHSESTLMQALIRPSNAAGKNYTIYFRRKDQGSHNHVIKFMRSIAFKPIAEAVGGNMLPRRQSEVEPK